jgi:hypothetical protein
MAPDGTNEAFDRAAKGRSKGHRRDAAGKEALFSTAPSSAPPPAIDVRCPACNVTSGLTNAHQWMALLRPPFLVNPLDVTVWNRCRHCGERVWLEVGLGQALRSLLDRPSA